MNRIYGFGKVVMGIALWGLIGLLTACGSGGGSAPAPKAWGIAALNEINNSGNAIAPQVAIDTSGNAWPCGISLTAHATASGPTATSLVRVGALQR